MLKRAEKEQLINMDCSALIYPYIGTRKINQSFRLEADVDRTVDPKLLCAAVRRMQQRFPTAFVRIRKCKTAFRLQPIEDVDSVVMPERASYCTRFDLKTENLIRVTYKERRVGLEIFHSVTDGTGGMILLKTLLAEYFRLLGYEIPVSDGVCSCDDAPPEDEMRDSFVHHYEKGLPSVSRLGRGSFHYGESAHTARLHITEITVPLAQMKALTNAANATVTQYCSAMYLYVLYQAAMRRRDKRPVCLSIPINLRPIFQTESMRNFSLYFFIYVPRGREQLSFEELLEHVKEDFSTGTDKDLLTRMLCTNVSSQSSVGFRLLPRPVKHAALKFGGYMLGERLFTSAFSNLGVVRLPQELASHVQAFRFFIGETPQNCINASGYCYNDRVGIVFSSRLTYDASIEDEIAAFLRARGIDITVRKR